MVRTVSFATSLWLFGCELVEADNYLRDSQARIDDAWELPEASRAEGVPLWDRDADWLAELRLTLMPWATEVLALPYVYRLLISGRRSPDWARHRGPKRL